MSSGNKNLQINLQERAVSADINRLQSFADKDFAELFRYMMDVTANDDLDAAAVITEPSTIETPLRAEIMNGLLVRPQAASLNLLVDPGVAYLMAPDAGADDSNYKFVHDAGVTVLGSLVMTANGAGTTRIDVIECQRNSVDLIVTDNRDIFNTTTGLFAAASVTKERSARLTYRVRAGTAGGGYPGNAAGWLPLAVASVPAGAASVDAMDFWDVRPIVSDRAVQPFGLSFNRPRLGNSLVNAGNPGPTQTKGLLDVVYGNRRLGGILRSGSIVADADYFSTTAAANQEAGAVFVNGTLFYLYLLTPFGLPRWARYYKVGTRVPRSPRGIPVISNTSPDGDGNPTAAIALPTATGLGGTTSSAVAVMAGIVAGGPTPQLMQGDNTTGYIGTAGGSIAGPAAALAADRARYVLTAGTHFPRNARAIRCRFTAAYTTGGAAFIQSMTTLGIYVLNSAVTVNKVNTIITDNMDLAAAHTIRSDFETWVDINPVYPGVAGFTLQLDHNWVINGNTPDSASMTIVGWKF